MRGMGGGGGVGSSVARIYSLLAPEATVEANCACKTIINDIFFGGESEKIKYEHSEQARAPHSHTGHLNP
jgi:hypothetical protein